MSRVKQPHLVPEFYLHYFSNKKGEIYVFDKPNLKSFQSKPKNVATQSGFYDLAALDKFFGKQIIEHKLGDLESITAPKYKDLLKNLECGKFNGFSNDERKIFSKFIYTQLIRTNASRNIIQQMDQILDDKMREIQDEKQYQEFKENRPNIDPKLQQLFMLSSNLDEIVKEFSDKIWTIYWNKTKFKFCTSDTPVNTYDHGSFPVTQHEIFIPLSPNFLLSLLDKKQFPNLVKEDDQIVDLKDGQNIKFYNSVIINKAERQVFKSISDFRFTEKLLNNFPQNKNLNRNRIESGN